MNLPFTADKFFEVMKNYNLDVWPMQVLLNILALAAVFFAIKRIKFSDKKQYVISSLLVK